MRISRISFCQNTSQVKQAQPIKPEMKNKSENVDKITVKRPSAEHKHTFI